MLFKIVAMNVKEALIGLIHKMSDDAASRLIPIATLLAMPVVQAPGLAPRIEVSGPRAQKPAKYIELLQEITAHDGMILRLIPPTPKTGVILGGNGESDNLEHTVILSKPFYMGKYQVTNRQWDLTAKNFRFASANLPTNPSFQYGERFTPENHPVVGINWYQAIKFLFLHSLDNPSVPQSRKNQIWRSNSGFQIADRKLELILREWILNQVPMDRLPTEAEWEYAARALSRTRFNTGDTIEDLDRAAIRNTNSTRPVGTKASNNFGLFDMHGNVWEWCADRYDSKAFDGAKPPLKNPVGPENGNAPVLRGGSWFRYYGRSLSSAYRGNSNPDGRSNYVGLRLVRTTP